MNLTSSELLYFAGLSGVAVFAISGALAGAEKKLDVLGFVLFATVAGVGGGTVRDLILDTPVFWVKEVIYLHICVIAAVLTYFMAHRIITRQRLLIWTDAMGLALFSVTGAAKAYNLGFDPMVAVVMGVMTPTLGSVMRDILLDREVVLLEPEIYVTAALVGALSWLGLNALPMDSDLALLLAIIFAFFVRGAAIIWDLRLPKFSK